LNLNKRPALSLTQHAKVVMAKLLDQTVDHGVSQIIQSGNQWAWDLYKKSLNAHWSPFEAPMSEDIRQWKDGFISDDEKLLVKRILGLFSAGESLVSNSIFSVERKYLTDGCVRQYLGKKDFEEQLHNATVAVCCESYGFDVKEVAEAYKSIPSVKKKTRFLKESLDSFEKDFDISTTEGKIAFVRNLYIVYMLMEGVWFFSAFCAIMSLGRQKKLPGLYFQIDYTIADETRHVEFGARIINQIKEEYPKVWTKELREDLTRLTEEAISLEIDFVKDALPNGLLGINSYSHELYAKFLASRRMSSVGLVPLYSGVTNPYGWISETQGASVLTNFFEATVRDYQSASALDDDF
jgi:ribonucleoside-diphosphate reductase beta chain